MRITQLRLENLRNVTGAELETDSPFVIIGGNNAAGKTTLLESIHLLLAGRSFHTREWSKLINHSQSNCLATARIRASGVEHFVGCSRTRSVQPAHRLDGEDVKLSSIAKKFPIQLFDNSVFELFEGVPKYRRQLLDWGLFHVKHDFFESWRRYNHALKQRNALLKNHRGSLDQTQLDAWDREMIHAGEHISKARADYAEQLLHECSGSELLRDIDIGFAYFQGWPESLVSLDEALKSSREKDIQYKRTTMGPHHSDLKIVVQSKKAGDVLSRGQKKLAGFAIKIQQVKMYNCQSDSKCLLLCDDFAAELDMNNQQQILDQLSHLGSQVFITAIDPKPVISLFEQPELAKVFHVKHGEFVLETNW